MSDYDTDRQHFNGGYHDGNDAQIHHRTPEWAPGTHFSPAYEAAYWQARFDTARGTYQNNSSAAWVEYQRQRQNFARTGCVTLDGVRMLSRPGAYIVTAPGVLTRADLAAVKA